MNGSKFFLFLVVLLFIGCSSERFELRSGDLLFQLSSSEFSDAIAESTSNKDGLDYTHVGIVVVERDSIFVVEATPPQVCKTPLDEYLNRSAKIDNKPIIAVGRLLSEYYPNTIDRGIEFAQKQLGKPYDFLFMPDNGAYYCSELVYESFVDEFGDAIFSSYPMTFKNDEGVTAEGWISHFEQYNTPIPEGVIGTNPASMSSENVIKIVYLYY